MDQEGSTHTTSGTCVGFRSVAGSFLGLCLRCAHHAATGGVPLGVSIRSGVPTCPEFAPLPEPKQ